MSKRINLIIESEKLIDTHFHVLPSVLRGYIAEFGEKDRYTIHLLDKQVNIYGSGQKWADGHFHLLKKNN